MPLLLIRHGETEWSATRRHTGRTDVPLNDAGRAQAASLVGLLQGIDAAQVLTSPLSRARETCELAGFGAVAQVDDRLVEWDYGDAEGRTTAEIRQTDPGWSVWTHGAAGAETLDDMAARADAVLAAVAGAHDLADPAVSVLLFAHAHLLRILAARWCQEPAILGSHLLLEPASVSVLAYERETPCIDRWNRTAGDGFNAP